MKECARLRKDDILAYALYKLVKLLLPEVKSVLGEAC